MRIILNVLARSLLVSLWLSGTAFAQGQLPNHSLPVATGGGSWRSITPCAVGSVIAGNGASSDPSCQTLAVVGARERLVGSRDYFVRTDGSDSNTGLANTSGGAFLTPQRCINVVSFALDLNQQAVQCRVQGGTYTGNIILPGSYEGYTGNGFAQFKVIGENGTVTLTSATASPVIFGTKAGTPWNFENVTITNPAASGIGIEMDDFGFVALKTVSFGATGAGGIKVVSILNSQVLLMASTFQHVGDSGTLLFIHSGGLVTTQPSVVFNASGAVTYSNAVVDVDATSRFFNSGSTFTGTTPTANPYNLVVPGNIFDVSLIPGSGTSVLTPLAVAAGGTGRITVKPPTMQVFTSGTNATYTTPAGATMIEPELVGGGGGGAGSGTTPGAATAGGATCWNTSGTACSTPVYQAGGGTLGSAAGATSAAGGTVSGSGTCTDSQPGGTGGAGAITPSAHGGAGGTSRYAGHGLPGWGGANNATAAATNSGSGGGGAGENATANAGGGGGAGAWCRATITSPAGTYVYTIGANGAAGTAGTGGNAGAAGAAGKLIVREYYNYLLKRDLGPANDNAPMFLSAAA